MKETQSSHTTTNSVSWTNPNPGPRGQAKEDAEIEAYAIKAWANQTNDVSFATKAIDLGFNEDDLESFKQTYSSIDHVDFSYNDFLKDTVNGAEERKKYKEETPLIQMDYDPLINKDYNPKVFAKWLDETKDVLLSKKAIDFGFDLKDLKELRETYQSIGPVDFSYNEYLAEQVQLRKDRSDRDVREYQEYIHTFNKEHENFVNVIINSSFEVDKVDVQKALEPLNIVTLSELRDVVNSGNIAAIVTNAEQAKTERLTAGDNKPASEQLRSVIASLSSDNATKPNQENNNSNNVADNLDTNRISTSNRTTRP